ncbi:MAG: hypothetical protein ABIN96_08800 [Rubrivivax sp.]
MTISTRWLRALLLPLFAVAMLAGCATPGAGAGVSPKPAQARDNALLNDGYSLLYEGVSGLRFSDDLLLVKFESDRLERVIKSVSSGASKLRADLQRIAKDYPAVQIDRKPLPEIEVEKRSAVNKDRLLSIAPLTGQGGPGFERTLLLSTSGALNQMQFLCQVMAEAEPDPNLRRFLTEAEQGFAKQYESVVELLNEVHFKHNTYKRR